jgi:transcriptional regulator with XRE-family HTH domain
MKLDSQKVRWHRDQLGWTLDALAEKAEIAKGTVLRAEHGEDIRPSSGRRIARAFGVEIPALSPEKPGAPSPKVTAPPSPPPEPSFNDVLEERRTTAFIKSLRAYLWDLQLRWNEPGPEPTPGQVKDALDLLQSLFDQNAFEGSWTPAERLELQLLFQAANLLRPIAENRTIEEEEARRKVDEVFEELEEAENRLELIDA